MNEKLNTVFDIINATNTVSANRYLSHALGAEVAIIYNALLAKYAYYSKHDMIPDDWFYSTIDDLWRSTALSEKTQKRAIAILVKEGLIECKRKGMPAKRSFFICNAYEKIVALIEKGKAILGETTAETAKSKAIEGDSAVQPKRQNKNSRKSATSYAVSAEHTYNKTKENNQKLYKHQQKTVADVMQTAIDKGTYYHGEYKTPGEVSEAVSCIDENGMRYITDCCEKHRSKINNLKAYIPLVGVLPRAQHQGIATRMMEIVCQYIKEQKFKVIGIHSNNPIAIKAYQKLGFRILNENERKYLEKII